MLNLRIKKSPVIFKKMAGFLFMPYIRNKSFCKSISCVILVIHIVFLAVNPAYALTITDGNYNISVITFLHAGGAVSMGVNTANWTAVGENIAYFTILGDTQYASLMGQLFLLAPEELPMLWIISSLQAKTDILGTTIAEKTWQKDNDPYFYWQVEVAPPDVVEGFSTSLDTMPVQEINTTEPVYQFPADSISSGKHIFYVLPYTAARGWDQESLASFEIWVDTDSPIIIIMQPQAGALTSDNHIPISCTLYDEHSGIDEDATTLTVNGQGVPFEYDEETRILTYTPGAPLPDGDNSVLVRAVDVVGNSEIKGWNFIVDTLPPTGGIMINGGEEITRSAYVSINIQASDATSGVKNIYLSNDGVFDTELLNPYPYSPLITNWLLREPDVSGKKTVYAKFEDTAGNLSQTYQDEITLELMTPNTRIISGPATITEETGAKFLYEASKEGCLFSYKLDNLNWSDWQSAGETQFSGLATGNHYFYVKAGYDLNGDHQITIDEEDPTPAQWVWTIKPEGYFEKLRERILFWRR